MKIRLGKDGWLIISFNARDMAFTQAVEEEDALYIKSRLFKSMTKKAAKLNQVTGEKV